MYRRLKNITKSLIPKPLLIRLEPHLRSVISVFYRGNAVQCNVCKIRLRTFIKVQNGALLCPNCGSLPRTRRLHSILEEKEDFKGRVLHFSPSPSLYRILKSKEDIDYFSSDFANEFSADYSFDITDIAIEDNFFDTVICFHVLEHIPNDQKAMEELKRVLKPNGVCYIQTPYKEGQIYEDPKISSKSERKQAFGQEDHVRVYSVDGLMERLNRVGFITKKYNFKEHSSYGLEEERIILAKKPEKIS